MTDDDVRSELDGALIEHGRGMGPLYSLAAIATLFDDGAHQLEVLGWWPPLVPSEDTREPRMARIIVARFEPAAMTHFDAALRWIATFPRHRALLHWSGALAPERLADRWRTAKRAVAGAGGELVRCTYVLAMPYSGYDPESGDRPGPSRPGGCHVALSFDGATLGSTTISLGAAGFAEADRLRAAFDDEVAAQGGSAIARALCDDPGNPSGAELPPRAPGPLDQAELRGPSSAPASSAPSFTAQVDPLDPFDVQRYVSWLQGAPNLGPAFSVVDRLLREARVQALIELWHAIESARDDRAAFRGPYDQATARIEDGLAKTSGAASLDALLALVAAPRGRSTGAAEARRHALGRLLAEHRDRAELLASVARPDGSDHARDVLASWMHEAILRGMSLDDEPAAMAFRDALVAAGHPLAWLPLSRLEIEIEIDPASRPSTADGVPVAPSHAELPERVSRVEPGEPERRMQRVLRPRPGGSNDHVEAAVFHVDRAVDGPPDERLLQALPLACLRDAAFVHATQVDARIAWHSLFNRARLGGGYSTGLERASARWAAWQALAGLVDAPDAATPLEVQTIARACRLATFEADSPWFHAEAWDLGVLAVRPDGRSVAVLAATDTD